MPVLRIFSMFRPMPVMNSAALIFGGNRGRCDPWRSVPPGFTPGGGAG
jgi:hypothetical protein